MIMDQAEYFAHYGILRKSGRYPWGSGDTQNARNRSFLDTVGELHRQGMTDTEICKGFDITTTQLRAARTIARNEQKQSQISMALRLKDKGYSNGEIAIRMGLPGESSVRALTAAGAKDRAAVLTNVSKMLQAEVDAKKFVDVGSGVATQLGMSDEKLNAALGILKEKGYQVHPVDVPQIATIHDTRMKVLVPPGVTQREAWENRLNIQQIKQFSNDGGRTTYGIHDPIQIDPKRVEVRYGDEGGSKADGVIYVRPGITDVSLGKSRYAQVRIQVGDSHYLKGMAMYKEDLPDGVDLLFNTNKERKDSKLDALKKLERDVDGNVDKDLPFGSIVRQIVKDEGTPNEQVTSAMNIVNAEGKWGEWSRNLSSQVLSKQSPRLAKEQLDMTFERKQNEFKEIMSITNPAVKKKLLEEFAKSSDSSAVHLKAAALPKQASQVILPIDSMPRGQIYAPNYTNGDTVVLIRFPHGGTFEIPQLTVNNKHPEAKRLLGDAKDAVGIHSSVAERLSGADFDGDTVLVIPNREGKIKTTPALEGLKKFDPSREYPKYDGMVVMTKERKEQEMGFISNLITDMTIKQASHEKLVRAIRHSMVVIDAEKHELNYKLSAQQNGIKQLKEEYQGSSRGGASTLISRKKGELYLPETKPRPQSEGGPFDRETGQRIFVETGRTKRISSGERIPRKVPYNKLDITDDAHTLSSGTPMEKLYANHSNKLKAMANQARVESIKTPPIKWSPSAKKAYIKEVETLNSKLALAIMNRPLERQAQVLGQAQIKAKKDANPNMDDDTYKKLKYQALEQARVRTGAQKTDIIIEPKEWEAIQAGAISANKLNQILNKADMDVVRSLATPQPKRVMTPTNTVRAKSMLASGYTRAEVSAQLGISLSTLNEAITEGSE